MNKQKLPRDIEWTRIVLADGTVLPGYTWNPIAGCLHGCEWTMPDGSIASCYAGAVAGKFKAHYPDGFDHHYWHPQRLDEPRRVKNPAGIFAGSMTDMFGHWVPRWQVQKALSTMHGTPRHTYFVLTKNAPRLLKFDFPGNVWVGVSSPPDHMHGKALTLSQKRRMLEASLGILSEVRAVVRWMSFEPLSWDVASVLEEWEPVLDWAVIGAASNGRKTYQPSEHHVNRLLNLLDSQGVPVFFKGNLQWEPRRNAFPQIEQQLSLF